MRVRPRSRMQMHKGNDLHRWSISFADFMTLMFAVFVVLYAVSVNDKEQYKEVMVSFQKASKLLNQSVFSSNNEGILTHNSNSIRDDSGPAMLSEEMINQANDELSAVDTLKAGWELSDIKLALDNVFISELDKKNVELDLNGDWLTIEMGGELLFAGGSHTLLNSANEVVNKISEVLSKVNNLLRIRGYSDNETIADEIYRSNWELSGMRAFSVLHALNKQGISGERMVVEAYGRYSPVINGNNRVDSLKSRRVVIAISKYAVVTVEKNSDLSENKLLQKVLLQSDLLKSTGVSQSTQPKEDSEKMHEVYLPNNRLIITTRQE
ncbi:OmpA/MotB family protein [Psychromonas hadalis]|uniref:OmpA/MotB family protein n=1 Tax=Psychromonas hadalis TaxID=211669 RepID=UPI0003B68ED3|nr:flagellar motor protein MotB [Psychromonas hadalis]